MFPTVSGAHPSDIATRGRVHPAKAMFTSRTLGYALIVGAFTFIAVAANAGWNPVKDVGNAAQSVGKVVTDVVTPPHVDVQVDLKKPLTPVTAEVKKDGVSVTIQPSPVPAPPVVHAPGNGFIANTVNTMNDVVQKPKNWIDQKGEEINRGVIHLGNEIGMFWAKQKQKIEQAVADWINWLKQQAEKYGIYALAGIGALFLVRAFFGFLFGRRHNSRDKFAGYHA
jgi:hypothetical protein